MDFKSVHTIRYRQLAPADEYLLKQLRAVRYYSIMINESTNISTSQMLITYVRFLFGGAVSTRFLQIVDLPGGKLYFMLY